MQDGALALWQGEALAGDGLEGLDVDGGGAEDETLRNLRDLVLAGVVR